MSIRVLGMMLRVAHLVNGDMMAFAQKSLLKEEIQQVQIYF